MDYRTLNALQKSKMKQICGNEYKMEWEDPGFLDTLLGELPKVRHYQEENEVSYEISVLEKKLASYDSFLDDKCAFVDDVAKCINNIQKIIPYWYGVSILEIKECVRQQEFCLISGEGGIGKSYFVKCFEEELTQRKIPHLCVYGKFEKDIKNIDLESIIKANIRGFVLVVDAINEMTEKGQRDLCLLLKELKNEKGIRIIITYRTNAIDDVILNMYRELTKSEYVFPGVSFESALANILKMAIPDVYKYEDILYSNNALLLSMLCGALSDTEIINEEKNSVASVTYILEYYIKNSVKKLFKGKINSQGIDIWKDTKKIAQWMYINGQKDMDEKILNTIITSGKEYIFVMKQLGFLRIYEGQGTNYVYYTMDSLSDYLIARSLFEDIKGKDFDEQVSIIKTKIEQLSSIKEAIVIAIFDNLAPDFCYIKRILIATDLFEYVQYETLIKIRFNKEDIASFQRTFRPAKPAKLLGIMGGFTDKPFNCVNYMKDYFKDSIERQKELSSILSDNYNLGGIKGRLKNLLYFITVNGENKRVDEAYCFSLLCCAAPNRDVRCLATKLLYEILISMDEYKKRVIEDYILFSDYYIKESIIYVLSSVGRNNEDIKRFFNKLVSEEEELTAKSVKRIAVYLGNPYGYITWKRKNLFDQDLLGSLSKFMSDILWRVELMNKDFLPFKFRGEDQIEMHTEFLNCDKNDISEFNSRLEKEYSCVKNGCCNGKLAFERHIVNNMVHGRTFENLNREAFFNSYEVIMKKIFEMLQGQNMNEGHYSRSEDFLDSTYMKCVDIATGLFYGSLMCNYYTNQFSTYNNIQDSIGYDVYDPIEYGEEICITSPVSTYQDMIEKLGDYAVNRIYLPNEKDTEWVKDAELTRSNLLAVLEPICLKNTEWVMLAGRISIKEENKYTIKWKDTYDIWCCTSEKETIRDDGQARYLTIELGDYFGGIHEYEKCTNKPWLCKRINDIAYGSSVFDETSLVLPPAELIKYFGLKVSIADMSWVNSYGEKIIICNNNRNSYYKDPIGSTVFIRKDYLDNYLKYNKLKYFAFAEKYIPETGYADETSLHFEIEKGNISIEIHNGNGAEYICQENESCKKCKHGLYYDAESRESELEEYMQLVAQYLSEE